jgi:hypothetical protein
MIQFDFKVSTGCCVENILLDARMKKKKELLRMVLQKYRKKMVWVRMMAANVCRSGHNCELFFFF